MFRSIATVATSVCLAAAALVGCSPTPDTPAEPEALALGDLEADDTPVP